MNTLKRNADGLLADFPYKYTADGRIDWKAHVPAKFLYIAREYEDKVLREQGKPLAEIDFSLIRDEWLRIKLGGINYLANLRGYTSLKYHSLTISQDKASIVCEMEFIGNFETGMAPLICSGVASASIRSMDKPFVPYLETFAENRAFTRCVKRALQINILSDIEIGGNGKEEQQDAPDENLKTVNPSDTLKDVCAKKGVSFEKLRESMVTHNAGITPERENERLKCDPSILKEWGDIQPIDAWVILGKMQEKALKKPRK